jgi:transcriptional regulator with XRE-family HTH domain
MLLHVSEMVCSFKVMDEIAQLRLGNKIRKIREIKGFKQETVAEKIGLSLSSYGKIERGEVKLSVERLSTIASAMELPMNAILEFDEGVNINFSANTFNENSHGGYYQNPNFNHQSVEELKSQIETLKGVISNLENIVQIQKELLQQLQK